MFGIIEAVIQKRRFLTRLPANEEQTVLFLLDAPHALIDNQLSPACGISEVTDGIMGL